MRKGLAAVVMSLTAATVFLPAAPAGATSCIIYPEPDVEDVYCVLYGTPGVSRACEKLRVC